MKPITNDQAQDLAILFKMFADETRLKMMTYLFEDECCVCDLADNLNMTHSAVSHQLASLRLARIVKSEKRGKHVFYTLLDEHVRAIYDIAFNHIMEEKKNEM